MELRAFAARDAGCGLAEYPSLCGTNVARDFVELPSQIMENWAFEPEFLEDNFAKDYKTGEVIPTELVNKIVRGRRIIFQVIIRSVSWTSENWIWLGIRWAP